MTTTAERLLGDVERAHAALELVDRLIDENRRYAERLDDDRNTAERERDRAEAAYAAWAREALTS